MKFDLKIAFQEVSKEILDIIISVHETKMLKRNTKLLIRRALYLYKMIVVLLGMRTNEVRVTKSCYKVQGCFVRFIYLASI